MTRLFYKNFFLVFFLDIILVAFSWYFAYLLRFNFSIPDDTFYTLQHTIPLVVVIKLLSFFLFDLYQGMWRYTSLTDLVKILKAGSIASLVIILMILYIHGLSGFSRSIFIIDWFLTLIFISGSRVAVRLYFWLSAGEKPAGHLWKSFLPSFKMNNRNGKRLLIIGAGDCGEKICREIHDNPHLGYRIIGFIDDDPF